MERDLVMSAFENASQFFHSCESLKGWEGCKQYVAPDAPFSAQCEPLIDVNTVEAYTVDGGVGKCPPLGLPADDRLTRKRGPDWPGNR